MDSNKLNRAKKEKKKEENDNDSNKNSLFGWNNFSQQQIGARQTNIRMKKKRTQHKNGGNMKRKFELRECFVCRREAYKCQVQTNIIVLCGGWEEKKNWTNEAGGENVPGQKRIHNAVYHTHTHTVLKHSA